MKILIVDDDMMIRNWLSILIEQLGNLTIEVDSVSDANAALEYCNASPVNLVITDITMPQKTGLELIEELHNTHPEINTAVLSAYDNYDYIRYALKLGALDYILKAEMQLSDITGLLKKVNIFSDYAAANSASLHQHMQTDFSPLLSDFLDDDTISPETFLSQIKPRLELNNLAIEAFDIPSGSEISVQIMDICNKTLASECLKGLTFSLDNIFIMIYNTPSNIYEHQREVIQKLSLLLERNVNIHLRQSILHSCNMPCKAANELRDKLERCIALLHCFSFYKSDITAKDFQHLDKDKISKLARELRSYLEMQQYTNAVSALNQFVVDAHACHIISDELKTAITHFITLLLFNTQVLKDSYSFTAKYQRISRQISLAKTKEILSEKVKAFSLLYMEGASNSLTPRSFNSSIRKIIEFINHNYMHKLSLDDVACHVYLNKTYISQLLKKNMNTTFGSYLETIRINKAQELLSDTLVSVTCIAEQVGYTSQSYFTKAFKKKTGITPSKYRLLYNN